MEPRRRLNRDLLAATALCAAPPRTAALVHIVQLVGVGIFVVTAATTAGRRAALGEGP